MTCPTCRGQIEELTERVRQLEAAIIASDWTPPANLRITGCRLVILRMLYQKSPAYVSRDALYRATRIARGDWSETTDPRVIDVYLSKLRSQLAPLGITISTFYAGGWSISKTDRDRLSELTAPHPAEAAA